jgi:permuted papain-like amidase YaeF/Yiix C92 family enzyme
MIIAVFPLIIAVFPMIKGSALNVFGDFPSIIGSSPNISEEVPMTFGTSSMVNKASAMIKGTSSMIFSMLPQYWEERAKIVLSPVIVLHCSCRKVSRSHLAILRFIGSVLFGKRVAAQLPYVMNRHLALVCLLIFPLSTALCSAQEDPAERKPLSPEKWSKLRQGDIVFIRSRTANAELIAKLSNLNDPTDSDKVFTHCGIIFKDGEKLKVYEGEGRGAGHWLTLADWRKEESKGKVNGVETNELHNVYALRWNGQPALATGLGDLLKKAKALHDTSYDHGFCWSDDRAYCSELVWKAYAAGGFVLGQLPTMKTYVDGASDDVAKQIKGKLEATKDEYRNGRGYDPDEPAISPEDIFRSSVLIPVTDDSPQM